MSENNLDKKSDKHSKKKSDKNTESISEDKIQISNNQDINKFPEEKTKKEEIPKMNIHKLSNLADSIINYFSISICLFLHSAYNYEWFHLEDKNEFLFTYFIFAAVALYIIGILNWYEGKELLFIFDFVLSFYFLTIYFKEGYYNTLFDDIKKDIISDSDNNKLQGIFYILIFCLFFVLGFSAFKKGIIFIINYFILFVGFVFLFVDYYWDRKHSWIKKVHYITFIVSGALMWIIGILKIINHAFLSKDNILLGQTD